MCDSRSYHIHSSIYSVKYKQYNDSFTDHQLCSTHKPRLSCRQSGEEAWTGPQCSPHNRSGSPSQRRVTTEILTELCPQTLSDEWHTVESEKNLKTAETFMILMRNGDNTNLM